MHNWHTPFTGEYFRALSASFHVICGSRPLCFKSQTCWLSDVWFTSGFLKDCLWLARRDLKSVDASPMYVFVSWFSRVFEQPSLF